MTEQSYQECRKVMQKINHLRGLITSSEGEVAKWTKIESSHRENGRDGQADGAKKCLDRALAKLKERRDKFAAIRFPVSDLSAPTNRCVLCGRKLEKDEECLCEYQ